MESRMKKINSRDPHVELLRIMAAFIVVIVHTNLSAYVNGNVDFSRVFLKCCAADGVAIFWLITGFFYFKQKSWVNLLKKTVKTIVIPTLLLLIFWQFLGTRFLIDHDSVWNSVIVGFENIDNLKNTLLEFDTKYISHIGYLWYMMVYFLLMLLYPLFSGYNHFSSKEKNILLIIVIGIFILNDVRINQLMRFSHHTINGLIPAVMICVIGERLYSIRDFFRKRIWTFAGCAGFVLINVFRSCIQYGFYVRDESNYFVYWYSGMGILASVCLVIVCFSLPLQKCSNIINWLGSKTMGIYLIHIIVRDILESYNLNDNIYDYLNLDQSEWIREFLYTVSYAAIVMGISLAVIVVFDIIKNRFFLIVRSEQKYKEK